MDLCHFKQSPITTKSHLTQNYTSIKSLMCMTSAFSKAEKIFKHICL